MAASTSIEPMSGSKDILSIEVRYNLLKLLGKNPQLSQRDLAVELGVSLGKANYCIRALIDRGWVKVVNFRDSSRKAGYLYKLTPRGMKEKIQATKQFLKMKIEERNAIKSEIAALKREVADE